MELWFSVVLTEAISDPKYYSRIFFGVYNFKEATSYYYRSTPSPQSKFWEVWYLKVVTVRIWRKATIWRHFFLQPKWRRDCCCLNSYLATIWVVCYHRLEIVNSQPTVRSFEWVSSCEFAQAQTLKELAVPSLEESSTACHKFSPSVTAWGWSKVHKSTTIQVTYSANEWGTFRQDKVCTVMFTQWYAQLSDVYTVICLAQWCLHNDMLDSVIFTQWLLTPYTL